MAKRLVTLAAFLAAACGGGKDEHVNPATTARFTYGQPVSSGVAPPAGTTDALEGALALKDAPSSSSAQAAPGALLFAADSAFGDSTGFLKPSLAAPLVAKVRAAALAAPYASDPMFPPGCTVVSGNTVTFDGCTYSETADGMTLTMTIGGSVTASPDRVDWRLSMAMAASETGFSMNVSFADVGWFAFTPTTVDAEESAETWVTATDGLQTVRAGLGQAARLHVGYADEVTCPTRITGGTLEAVRFWIEKPAQATGPEFANRGALFTWTGCGTGTLQYSVQ